MIIAEAISAGGAYDSEDYGPCANCGIRVVERPHAGWDIAFVHQPNEFHIYSYCDITKFVIDHRGILVPDPRGQNRAMPIEHFQARLI